MKGFEPEGGKELTYLLVYELNPDLSPLSETLPSPWFWLVDFLLSLVVIPVMEVNTTVNT